MAQLNYNRVEMCVWCVCPAMEGEHPPRQHPDAPADPGQMALGPTLAGLPALHHTTPLLRTAAASPCLHPPGQYVCQVTPRPGFKCSVAAVVVNHVFMDLGYSMHP